MVGADDLRQLRDRFLEERPTYERLAAHVEERLAHVMRQAGIRCRLESRAKDPSSLLKKAIRKGYADPLNEIADKAGARIIVASLDRLRAADDLINEAVDVLWREDKGQLLNPTELGYLGIHYGVRVRQDDEARGLFGQLECEVQLNTAAQRAWADVSHELLYKPLVKPDPVVSRVLTRLMALMEIFDESVVGARETLMQMDGWKTGAVLAGLEQEFLPLAAHDYDRELSTLALNALLPAYGDEEVGAIEERLHRFSINNREKLERLFHDYADDPRHVMLFQPEAIAVFERLETEPFLLREHWQTALPVEFLEDLATVWGAPFEA